jgi:myo-inositol-1(or 4)-monophosphatase
MNNDVLESMIGVAMNAGNFVRHYYSSRDFGISEKKDSHDLVTDVDRESQKIISSELSSRFPDISIIGEEDKAIIKKKHAFFIDPLDGTLNFVKQIPFFTVSIGYWKDNQPICGVVFDPIRKDLFYARKGSGSYLNGRKIKTTNVNNGKYQLLASDWGHESYYYEKNIITIQRILKEKFYLFRFMGCASLAICYVGAGILNGYWHYKLSPWDMAAGVLIAQEAGATVTSINGKQFCLWGKNILVADSDIKNKLVPIFNSIEV